MVLHRLRHIPLHVPSLHNLPNHHIHKRQTLVRKTEKGRGVPPIGKKTLQKQTKSHSQIQLLIPPLNIPPTSKLTTTPKGGKTKTNKNLKKRGKPQFTQ